MSILIKKMEMPKGCWACPFAVGKHYECLFTKKSYNWGLTTRPSDCPLIEVQSPHGRLIDADALLSDDEIMQILTSNPQRTGKLIKEFAEMFVDKVNRQPTIIEAEGSDNG